MKNASALIASRIVIAFSACWLINLALARILGTGEGGIIIGPGVTFIVESVVCVRTLVDCLLGPGGLVSGEITAGMSLVIAGRAPGVLHLVFFDACMSF